MLGPHLCSSHREVGIKLLSSRAQSFTRTMARPPQTATPTLNHDNLTTQREVSTCASPGQQSGVFPESGPGKKHCWGFEVKGLSPCDPAPPTTSPSVLMLPGAVCRWGWKWLSIMDTLFGPRVPELSGSFNGGKLVDKKALRGSEVSMHNSVKGHTHTKNKV